MRLETSPKWAGNAEVACQAEHWLETLAQLRHIILGSLAVDFVLTAGGGACVSGANLVSQCQSGLDNNRPADKRLLGPEAI